MGDGGSSGAEERRIPFVSRRKPGNSLHHPDLQALGHPMPKLGDRGTLLLLCLTLALQAFAWSRSSGYQLADSVEFMDRAFAVARGETLDTTGAVRSFGFSTLLLPFFALAEWFELENRQLVVHAVRALQMVLGLGLVFFSARVGALLGGRRVGYVAGFLVAVNPTFLQYSSDPVSGIAAALFIAIALNVLILRREFWHALSGGLVLGLAFVMAYQTILIALPLVALIVLRDRWRFRKSWSGAATGIAFALAVQVVLDKLMYDSWGISIRTYLIENLGGVSISFLVKIGLEDQQWVRDAYESYLQSITADAQIQNIQGSALLQPRDYYLTELPKMLVWPVIAFGVLGLARSWLKMNWKSSLLVIIIALNVYAMSLKGSKSFRLWLPLLPLLAPICAWGWASLSRAGTEGRPEFWRRILSAVMLVASLVLGIETFNSVNTRRYGAYWEAMDFVNARVAEEHRAQRERGTEPVPVKVGSAYNWAVFCRAESGVRVIKFREHLDQWHALSEERKAAVFEQLGEIDWILMHQTALPVHADLTRAINADYELVASFWDEHTEPTIKDIWVLRRVDRERAKNHPPSRRPRRLWEVIEGRDPNEYREELQLVRGMPQPALFVDDGEGVPRERLILLGFEYEVLPESGLGWITYHWYTDTGFDRDYVLVDRISTRQCPWAWQNNGEPCYAALPMSEWQPGWIVRESYVMAPGSSPFEPDFHPLGGSYRRGDYLPAMLWLRGESPPPDINAYRLLPADITSGLPIDLRACIPWEETGLRHPDGHLLSPDQLLLVARFLLPVHERYRWPDDGSPGPDDAVIMAARRRHDRLLARLQAIEDAELATAGEE